MGGLSNRPAGNLCNTSGIVLELHSHTTYSFLDDDWNWNLGMSQEVLKTPVRIWK